MTKHLIKFLDLVLGFDENDSLISKEGYEILADPIKRVKLREWIENYHKTGEWDYSFWDESKHEKLNQHDVIAQLPFTSDCCNAKTEAVHVCTKCHNWCVGN
jgi:hypothetical protein